VSGEFIVLGAFPALIGIVFLIWPRQVERSVQDLFASMFGASRSYISMPARVSGSVLLFVGALIIAYGLMVIR